MITTTNLVDEFWTAARQGPKIYFAPLLGAVQAIRAELGSQSTIDVSVTSSVAVTGMSSTDRKR